MSRRLVAYYTRNDTDNGDNFNYTRFAVRGRTRVGGAFRVVRVKPLLYPTPELEVYEYPNVRWGAGGGSFAYKRGLSKAIPYLAVSHVWSHADDVDQELQSSTGTLDAFQVDVDPDPQDPVTTSKYVSWYGLREMAKAARHDKRRFLWIDFFCIDQKDKGDNEMGLQICIMADIYRNARWVMVMIGGVGAVVPARSSTHWMDRAWTLQESVVNPYVQVLVSWPRSNLTVSDAGSPPKSWDFTSVSKSRKPGEDNCLIKLEDLLDLADANPPIASTPSPTSSSTASSSTASSSTASSSTASSSTASSSTASSSTASSSTASSSTASSTTASTVWVVDGIQKKAGDVARRALRMALARSNQPLRHTGVWRSMYLRTSSKPADVVYSVAGIFNLQIDPFRKNRDPRYLFNDLARKTAMKLGPAWLTIGGVTGCDIPRHRDSGIVPEFPHAQKAGMPSNNKPPRMDFGSGKKEWAGYHVADSPWYIDKFNMKFASQSHPHIINAVLLPMSGPLSSPVKRLKVPRVLPHNKRFAWRNWAQFNIGGHRARLIWWSNRTFSPSVSRKLLAVFVGRIGDATKGPKPISFAMAGTSRVGNINSYSYFLFMQYKNRRWTIVGDGVFSYSAAAYENRSRSIFTIGTGSQEAWRSWPTRTDRLKTEIDSRSRFFHHTYGVEPLEDWGVDSEPGEEQPIQWFGFKREYPPGKKQRSHWFTLHYNIWNFISDPKLTALNSQLQNYTHPLYAVSTSARRNGVPQSAKTPTPWAILVNQVVQIPFSYGGWTRSQCSDLAKAGVDGILLHDPKQDPTATVTYLVSLRFGDRVAYLQMQQAADTPAKWSQLYVVPYRYRGDRLKKKNSAYIGRRCAPANELGLRSGASNREIGEAIARKLMEEFPFLPMDQARFKAMLMWGNLSGSIDLRAWQLRTRYCYRGIGPGVVPPGADPYAYIPL